MRDQLTGDDLFVYIMMQRQVDPRLVLLVEGPEDVGAIDPHVNVAHMQTLPGYGKSSLIAVVELLEKSKVKDVAVLLDHDLANQCGETGDLPDFVVVTENYDLIADLFFSSPQGLDRVLHNFASMNMVRKTEQESKKGRFQIIVDLARTVSVVRVTSLAESVHLYMRDFPMDALAEGDDVDHLSLVVEIAYSRSRVTSAKEEFIESARVRHLESMNQWSFICGHDLMSATASLIRRQWGGKVGNDTLGRAFRASVDCQSWGRLKVVHEISSWADRKAFRAWDCFPARMEEQAG